MGWYLAYLDFEPTEDLEYLGLPERVEHRGHGVIVQEEWRLVIADSAESALCRAQELASGIVAVAPYLRFRGILDLVALDGEPRDGLVLDQWTCRKAEIPGAEELSAFHPAGPGVPIQKRDAYCQTLWATCPWYKAYEQFVEVRRDEAGDHATAKCVVTKVVLLTAHGPQEAYDRAMLDGAARAATTGSEFLGLHELTLVTDNIEDGCELGWTVSERTPDQWARPTAEWTAFREERQAPRSS